MIFKKKRILILHFVKKLTDRVVSGNVIEKLVEHFSVVIIIKYHGGQVG